MMHQHTTSKYAIDLVIALQINAQYSEEHVCGVFTNHMKAAAAELKGTWEGTVSATKVAGGDDD